MATMIAKKYEKKEGQSATELVGTFSEQLKNFTSAMVMKNKAGNPYFLLHNAAGETCIVNISANLRSQMATGVVSQNQLGQCNVIQSVTEDGTIFYNLVAPNSAMNVESFLSSITGGDALSNKLIIPAAQVSQAL